MSNIRYEARRTRDEKNVHHPSDSDVISEERSSFVHLEDRGL